eukprot:TRINITY_DN1583_c0_g1_i4.p1 TRINITY_DN1583_c0_g1~~TRINITY_DN1583_c0_g1_i4.p1  ORF type:complete len:247 (+),score=56.63 TRINITY_DN1583_c0_g1_i4:90-830(+)
MNFSKLISFLVFFNLVFLNLIFCQESESETGSISESKTISESISESKTISESISESKTISESISESKSPSKSTSISSSISETSSVSPSFSASPSFDPEIDYCRLNTTIDDCDICVATESESECLWCSEGTCRDGNFFGPKNSTDCDSWYWKQCGLSGTLMLVIVFGGSCIILLLASLCLLYCMCWGSRPGGFCCPKKSTYVMSDEEASTEIQLLEAQKIQQTGTKTPLTDKKREEMRAKYGSSISY